jgi:hypothetical protein
MRLHDSRHSFATALLEHGVSPKTAQAMLGHASVAFTLDVYSHVTLELEQQAAATLNAALKRKGNEMGCCTVAVVAGVFVLLSPHNPLILQGYSSYNTFSAHKTLKNMGTPSQNTRRFGRWSVVMSAPPRLGKATLTIEHTTQ